MQGDLELRLKSVQARIAGAQAAAGRSAPVRLLAVSKGQPIQKMEHLLRLGISDFGENYAQEMANKAAQMPAGNKARFTFIGTVQSNKIALIVQHSAEIQSVSSERHARLIERAAIALGKVPYPIWILTNAAGEASKSGVPMTEVLNLAQAVATGLPHLALQGLMAIPPPLDLKDPATAPPVLYRTLRELAHRTGRGLLSLGMTHDLEAAILAGSDCVRIGTALFGPRLA